MTDSLYVQKRNTETGEVFDLCEIWPGASGKQYPNDTIATANTLEEMHAFVEKEITCGVDWSRVEPKYQQKVKDWIKKNGQFEAPEGIDFVVGDVVTYVNDYGVIWPGMKIGGFCIDGDLSKYGKVIHLETDAYWFPHAPGELVKESGRDITPELKWIYASKPNTDGSHQHRNAVMRYVREFHKETQNPAELARLKKLIQSGQECHGENCQGCGHIEGE